MFHDACKVVCCFVLGRPVSASCCSRSDIDLSTLSSIFIDVDVDGELKKLEFRPF